ncbi:MAG TPA: hypothetical protein DHW22_05085 [Planctomycetaceae bacterium]|nr:hypothetical protein [Planctomycetaceae bacterium]
MKSSNGLETAPLWLAILGSLRLTVALQCLGNWGWLSQSGETPLLHWIINPADIGGLHWNEANALILQQTLGWLALLSGVCVLFRPCAAVLGPLVLLQLVLAIAMWQNADGFPLSADLLPAEWVTLFPFLTQSARIAAPLGLLLLDPWRTPRPLSEKRTFCAMTLLRWAIAITFLAHGIESWQLNPHFIDLLIGASSNILGVNLPQTNAEHILSLIGAVDILLAILCVTTKSRWVLGWMALWGALTAISRIFVWGISFWHMGLVRVPHMTLPLIVFLYLHLLQCRQEKSEAYITW